MLHVFIPVDPSLAVCGCGRWIKQLDWIPETSVAQVHGVEELARVWREHWTETLQPDTKKEEENDGDQ